MTAVWKRTFGEKRDVVLALRTQVLMKPHDVGL